MSGGNVTGIIELKLKLSLSPDAPKYTSYSKVGDTDYGSVWKSEKHLLWREKLPLSLGTGRMLSAMERDKDQAKQAVVDDYIIDNA